MKGLISQRHRAQAERVFPGIWQLYEALPSKPVTFLELLWIYCDHEEQLEGGGFAPVHALGNP